MNTVTKTDDMLREEVFNRLLMNGEFDAHNLEIYVEDGIVKIEGDVTGRHAKRVTEKCLAELDGIRNIENRLKVRRISRFTDHSMQGF